MASSSKSELTVLETPNTVDLISTIDNLEDDFDISTINFPDNFVMQETPLNLSFNYNSLDNVVDLTRPKETDRLNRTTTPEIVDLTLLNYNQFHNEGQILKSSKKDYREFVDEAHNHYQIGMKHKSCLSAESSPNKIAKLESAVPDHVPDFSPIVINLNSNHTITSGDCYGNNQPINHNISQTCMAVVPSNSRGVQKAPPMFYQLLDLFPDIDEKFLSDQCHRELDIIKVTDVILEMNNNYPKKKQSPNICRSGNRPINENGTTINNVTDMCVQSTPNIPILTIDDNQLNQLNQLTSGEISQRDNQTQTTVCCTPNKDLEAEVQLEFLMQIFPKADPAFLKQKSCLKSEELKVFISDAIEKDDYPKKVTKIESAPVDQEDTGLYTTAFNIQNFLKIFPDPFEYFMDAKRICRSSTHAIEFMKRRYRSHTIKLICKTYSDLEYNLPKTCTYLDSILKPTRSTKRSICEIHMPETVNLPFLQEACFVEHKDEIKAYLDGITAARKLAYEQAEAKGELIECGCCYGQVMFEDCAACNEGDLFCKPCILKSTEIRIGDGLTTFPCLMDCGSQFSLHLLQNLLEARVFSRLLQRIQLDEVKAADIEGLEVCPFCDFATIPPPDTNIFTCLNPDCLKESCRKCHKQSHIPQRCEEIENDDQARARKYIEDEMTKALVRECYKCKKSFIKSDGCNKMTCTCGAKMCYICRKPVTDYKHFNGPGGSETDKCPLYSTEKVLHVDAVSAVAKKALRDVVSSNPNLKLKHDPTKVLPSASTASSSLPPGVREVPAMLVANLQQVHNFGGQETVRHNFAQIIPNLQAQLQQLHDDFNNMTRGLHFGRHRGNNLNFHQRAGRNPRR